MPDTIKIMHRKLKGRSTTEWLDRERRLLQAGRRTIYIFTANPISIGSLAGCMVIAIIAIFNNNGLLFKFFFFIFITCLFPVCFSW